MSVAATAAAAKEARRADIVPQQCIKINKDLLDALVKNLLKSASPGTQAAHLQSHVEQHLAKILPSIRTPDHPPYALMIRQAITELDEEEGSNEEAISELIKLKYKDLPWGHVNFLRHHLKKLKDEEEIFQVSGNRYKLSPEGNDSIDKVSKKRRRQSGKDECYTKCKVSKSGGSSKKKNYLAKEGQEQSGAAVLHFKESKVQKKQTEEQQKQEVTCGSRKESQLGLEVNEEVNEVHLDSEECERSKDATREEALHHMKDADGLEQQKQEVTCPPRQEIVLVVEINEEVSQVHIGEDASREVNSADEQDQLLEQQSQSGEQQKQEVTCVPSQLASESQVHTVEDASRELNSAEEEDQFLEQQNQSGEQQKQESTCVTSQLGSEFGEEVNVTQKECEGMEDVTPTPEPSNHIIADEGQVLLQGQEKEFREHQSREVSCTASKQTALGFKVNSEVNQLCEQECENTENVGRKEEENSVAIEEENSGKELSATIIEDLQNQMEVDPIQVQEDLYQMEEDNSLSIEREKEETTKIIETEDQQEVNCEKQDTSTEKQGAAGVSEGHFDGKVVDVLVEVGKVSAIKQQEQPMEMQGLSGVLEGQNVSKGAENLTEEQCDGSLQVAVIEKGQVKATGLQKQQQQWQPEVNEQHLQLKEIGAEIVEFIEKIITPQRPPKVVVGNKREGEACGHAAKLISSPALSTLRQEQCLELLNRTAKMQGIVVELLKSFGTAESSRTPSDLAMLESNETEHSDEQLPNATAETALPSCRDMVVAELPLNQDLSVVEPPQQNVEEASMLDSQCQNEGKHSTASEAEQQEASGASAVLRDLEEQLQFQEVAVAVEPKEQIEQPCNSSANTLQLEETMVENHREKQPELHSVQQRVVGEEATKTALLLNLNSTLDMSGFLPEQEALNNKEPSVENYFQLKLPDLQPETNLSIHLEGKEIPGPTVSAEPALLSLSLASQEQQQKPTKFVDGNQQLHQQNEQLPTPVSQQNAEPSFCQPHVQSESQSVNLVKITEDNNEMLQPNLLQGGPKVPSPFSGDANNVIFGTPQKQQQQQTQLPSAFDAGSLFQNSLFQQPLTISPMKPSSLSGGKLQPLKPKELKKLVESVKPEQVTPKKRRGRPPKQKIPGQTPSPQSRRPKIRQTVPKKPPSAAADGEEAQSPAKRGPGRPQKRVKVAAPVVEEPVIIPKNPF